MKAPSKKAVEIAKNYPMSAAFVQLCLNELNDDATLTRRWLDALAKTGGPYFTPSVASGMEPPELELKP